MLRVSSLVGIAIALASLLLVPIARADCLADPPSGGRTAVSCTGDDADGFVAGGDDFDVTVEDEDPEATVDGGAATVSIQLDNDSTLTNDGQVTLATDDGRAVLMGADATLVNNDTISASGTDSRAIEVGDNADITNQGGTITGGADGASATGYAIWFRGSDAAANNVLNNAGSGVISTSGSVAIEGSDGSETLTLSGTSTVTGDINLGAGNDAVSVSDDASVTGTIVLGAGDDVFNLDNAAGATAFTGSLQGDAGDDDVNIATDSRFAGSIDLGAGNDDVFVEDGASLAANLMLGEGNDRVILRSVDDPASDQAAILTGNVDLGNSGTETGEENLLRLQTDTRLEGDVIGGAQVDNIEMISQTAITGSITLNAGDDILAVGQDSTIGGMVELGAGADELLVGEGVTFTSAVDLGDGDNEVTTSNDVQFAGGITALSGSDSVVLSSGVVVTGTVDLGAGDDRLELGTTASVTVDVLLGAGSDTVAFDAEASVDGTIDLGAGDDVFQLKPTAVFPTNLTVGTGVDTLQLDALPSGFAETGVADLTALQAAPTDGGFDSLVIGPDPDTNPPFNWLVSTTAPTPFSAGVELRSGALVYDGAVELVGDFSQKIGTVMVFDIGNNVDDSMLSLDGVLTIDPTDDGGTPEDPEDDVSATAEVTINGSLIEGDYTLIETTGGIVGDFEEVTVPALAAFSFEPEIVGTDYRLTVIRESTYDEFARDASERNVGKYLDAARLAAGSGSFAQITAELDTLGEAELATALSQLNPESYDAQTSSVLAWGRAQQRVLQQRPMHCERYAHAPRPEIVSASPCGARGIMPWAKVVGTLANHSGAAASGYDVLGGGVLVGVDGRVSERLWWSADAGFGHVEVEHDNDAKGDFDSIDLGVAAGWVRGGLNARGSLTYSHGFHDVERKIDFLSDRARGEFDSDRVTIATRAGYRMRLGPLVVEPNATFDYTHVKEESVEEQDAGDVSLDLDGRKTEVFAATGGLTLRANILKYRYVGNWLEWADGLWTPTLNLHWRQAFGDVDRDIEARMQGAPGEAGGFDAEAKDSDGGLEVGGGIVFQPLGTGATVEIGYDGYFGDDVTTHSVNASLRVPF